MSQNSVLNKCQKSKEELMNKFDFKGVQFYLFLPSFAAVYRKKLCSRISEFQGQVTLTPKAGNQYVIVSDNVVGYVVERDNMRQIKEYYGYDTNYPSPAKENKYMNVSQSKRTKRMLIGKPDVSNKGLYKSFMQEQIDTEKNEKAELVNQFDDFVTKDLPIIKITDFHHVLDYFDSFTKFEWHTKKDDSRLLRSLVNGEGCFIVTSRKKVYMKFRHRMEFHKFSRDQVTRRFEVPQLCLDAPLGTSIFQTPTELRYSLENKEKIEGKYKGMIQKVLNRGNTKPATPCSNNAKICSKLLIAEPKPKKDTYFCCICNDDYHSYISHIATNQHKLSSYADNLAEYYEKIDQITCSLDSDLIKKAVYHPSPRHEDLVFSEQLSENRTPEKEEKVEGCLSRYNHMIDSILFKDTGKKESGKVRKFTAMNIQRSPLQYNECEFEQDYKTAKFNQNFEAGSSKDKKIFEESNLELEKQDSEIKVPLELVKIDSEDTNLKAHPEISMSVIEPANPMSPRKPSPMASDKDSATNAPQGADSIKKDLKTPKSEKKTANGTPEFHKFSKQALGIQDSSVKKLIHKTINSSERSECESPEYKNTKLIRKNDPATISACKVLLKKNKLELVGILVSGKNEDVGSEQSNRRETKSVRKQLESTLEALFSK